MPPDVSSDARAASEGQRPGLLDRLSAPMSARTALLQLATGLGLGVVLFGGAAVAVVLADRQDPAPTTPTAVFLTGGSVDGSLSERAGEVLGWQVEASVHPGAGISTAPDGAENLTQLAREETAVQDADIVVVQGGEGDAGTAPGRFQNASLHLLDWLDAQQDAGKRVAMVGPVPGSDQSPEDLQGVDGFLSRAAGERGVPYLSALGERLSRTDTDLGAEVAEALRPLVPTSR